jgi:hypothetical protein
MVLLEYGSTWYERNEDARLVRIVYTTENKGKVKEE